MDVSTGLIAVVPDHLPGVPAEDLRAPYAGRPLIEHSILFANACREVRRTLIATPDAMAEDRVPASGLGLQGDAIAFRAPSALTFPDFELLRSAVDASETIDGEWVKLLLLLNPVYPRRDPLMLMECFQRLIIDGFSDGITAGESFFLFRRAFVEEAGRDWREKGRFLTYEIDSGPAVAGPGQEK